MRYETARGWWRSRELSARENNGHVHDCSVELRFMHVGDCCFSIGLILVEDVCCSAVRHDYGKISGCQVLLTQLLTLPVYWHVNFTDYSIDAKDFAQVVFIDIFGKLFHHNLRASRRSSRAAIKAARPSTLWTSNFMRTSRSASVHVAYVPIPSVGSVAFFGW